MANFMDKMKESYDSVMKGISTKSYEPTEIERVIENMAQVEVQMQQKFTQIGQIYYLNNVDKEELDSKYKILIDEIKKLDENRKGFYAHKLRLEGNMMCVNCGEIVPYGSVYCSKCGKKTDQKED